MAPLPLPPGRVSNGEFIPGPATQDDDAVLTKIRASVDTGARAAGMDRRRFLQSAGGVAASLAAFNLAACAHTKPAGSPPGGSFTVPTAKDVPACEHALGGQGEFIVDVHTHHVMPDGPWRHNAPDTVGLIEAMLPGGCQAANRLQCVNQAAYLHDIFLASDTAVAMLTDVPNSGPTDAPLPFPAALDTAHMVAQLAHGGANRLLVNQVLAPNVGPLGAQLDAMTAAADGGKLASFKVYTAWSPTGRGYSLEDPAIGLPVIQHAHDLGVKVFIAHKGLPLVHFDPTHNGPDDIVAVSRQFPDMNFVVFHAAWDPRHREGSYGAQSGQGRVGIDSLLAALDRHQVPANDNVWVDLGTVWRQVLTDPDQAAHVLGKLLTRVGADRVLWGTDAIWYGGPQAQIMALRAFQISTQYQERFGYPALTDDLKAKIFGLNAAHLFAIDPHATRCALQTDPLTTARPAAAELQADGALPSPWAPKGPTTRREMLAWLSSPLTRWTPL
ncbi:MAG: amidohydrolase [Actinomycetota bacterium]|nr:amidohydrolase [Actinomycetota bacterium]